MEEMNKFTWCVRLWVLNEQGLTDAVEEIIKDGGKENEIKEFITGAVLDTITPPERVTRAGLTSDLLQYALLQVNWTEIYEAMNC